MNPSTTSALQHRFSVPWAVDPGRLASIRELLTSTERGHFNVDAAQAKHAKKPAAKAARSGKSAAIIPICGTLVHRTDFLSEMLGEVGCDDIGLMLDDAMAAPDIDTIIFDINSPGGSVYGVAELAAKMLAARSEKKTIGVADPLAASGAYWLLSQCSIACVTPSGQVGSIGVYEMQVDQSKYLDLLGVKVNVVKAGKLKASSNPYEPLSQDGRSEIQRGVDDYYYEFVKAVAKGRGVSQAKVREGFGQGGMMRASGAITEGMADKVATLDDVLSGFSSLTVVSDPSKGDSRPAHLSSKAATGPDYDIEIRKRKLQLGRDLARVSQRPQTLDDLRVAIHEAGHAFVSYHCGAELESVSIRRVGDSSGRVLFYPTGKQMFDAAVLYGGTVAVEQFFDDPKQSDLSPI